MAPVSRWLAFAWLVAAFVLVARPVRAEVGTAHTVAVAVLALDSDDAEDNADALTLALRSRIRASQGWSLLESTQSLGMLTAALRCPSRPVPADCEQRIAEQLKTDRYLYGFVTKGPQQSQVTAELHLYQKSKPDTVIRESYADNLKDPNDDTLRKIAQRVIDRLGNNAVGSIVVKMGAENGEVIVDGDKRIPLQSGTARLELAPGSHSVEVQVGGQTQKRNVLVTVGKETVVDLALSTSSGLEDPFHPGQPLPVRQLVGGGMMGLGAVSLVVGVLEFVAYKNRQDDGEKLQKSTNPQDVGLPAGKSADDVCGTPSYPDALPICKANSAAKQDSALGWVFTGLGAALVGGGAYVFFTHPAGEAKDKPAAKPGPRLVPQVGRNGGGLFLSGSF